MRTDSKLKFVNRCPGYKLKTNKNSLQNLVLNLRVQMILVYKALFGLHIDIIIEISP